MFAIMALTSDDKIPLINTKNILGAVFLISYLFIFWLNFKNNFTVFIPVIALLFLLAFFAYKTRWRFFILGGIIMTYIVHWKWLIDNSNMLNANFIILTLYFVLFNILIFILYRQKSNIDNIFGIICNSAFYYGLMLWLCYHPDTGYQGLFTAGVAVFFLILSFLAHFKKYAAYFNTYIVLCFGYLALAIPLQFNQEWITISWAVLALVLVSLSFKLKEIAINILANIVGAITVFKILFLIKIRIVCYLCNSLNYIK